MLESEEVRCQAGEGGVVRASTKRGVCRIGRFIVITRKTVASKGTNASLVRKGKDVFAMVNWEKGDERRACKDELQGSWQLKVTWQVA